MTELDFKQLGIGISYSEKLGILKISNKSRNNLLVHIFPKPPKRKVTPWKFLGRDSCIIIEGVFDFDISQLYFQFEKVNK